MWKQYKYRCRTCGYTHQQTERDSTLFMAETHALGSEHYDGLLQRIDHSEDDKTPLIPIVMFTHTAEYVGNKWVVKRK